MNYPRLFVGGEFNRIITPVQVSITENIVPLSTATITLPKNERLPSRSYVELFTPYGSAGMFRVRQPRNSYGNDTNTAELEHMVSAVGDWLVKEKIEEMLPANTAMTRVFSHYKGRWWKLGSVSALGSGKVAVECDYDRILDVMISILRQKPDCMMAFNFNTTPWTINIVKKGTTVSAEGRLSRNVTNATVSYDDSELVTRVWYRTFTTKNNEVQETWNHKDAPTQKRYGTVEGTVSTDSRMTAEEIDYIVNTYIEEHKEPRVNVSIQASELARITGESMDKFTIGKKYRLAIPDYSFTLEDIITSITWNDPYNNPRDVTVVLGDEEDTEVTFLHNLDAKGSGGGGGGGAKKDQEEKEKEYWTTFDRNDRAINMTANRVNKAESIFEQAGLSLTSKGTLIYATDKSKGNYLTSILNVTADGIRQQVQNIKEGLESSIEQTATQIRSEVKNTKEGLQSSITQNAENIELKVSKNGVISAINQTAESIEISASRIDINGIVSALQALSIRVQNLTVDGDISCNDAVTAGSFQGDETIVDDISCDSISVSEINGRNVSWKTASIPFYNFSASHAFMYKSGDNTPTVLGRLMTSEGSTSITYLG